MSCEVVRFYLELEIMSQSRWPQVMVGEREIGEHISCHLDVKQLARTLYTTCSSI